MNYRNFTLEVRDDGVAVVTFNVPGKAVNLIDAAVVDELAAIVEVIAGDASIKGAVITSGKSQFCAGADLAMVRQLIRDYRTEAVAKGEEAATRNLMDRAARLSRLYRRLETQGKPVVAAINGAALGGGLELALACHRRIAEDAPGLRLGLPEVTIGMFAGAGGTQRLPRLIGAEAALKLLLQGRLIELPEARKLGLVDEVVGVGQAVAAGRRWIAGGGRGVQAFDEKGYTLPAGEVYSPRGMRFWPAANALYRKETFDNYEARRATLRAVYDGLLVKSMASALAIEERLLTQVLRGHQAVPMMRTLFQSTQELAKGARRPANVADGEVRRLGVVGAGFMGAGIAYVAAKAGIEVVLIDRDADSAAKGKSQSATLIAREVERGRATSAEAAELLQRIAPNADYGALTGCDLVIEAVFENKGLKADVLRSIDQALGPEALLASNTSTLPITELGQFTGRPASFVGIHFFSPVDRMQLVEIIRGKSTGDAALAKAIDFVRQIRKTPIVVNDSRGFFTSRVVMTYMAEGAFMLEEGVPPALIENAGRMAGMPVGPLALNDEIALDLAWKILQATKADLGAAYEERAIDRIVEEMVVKRERFGRKNRRGFYDYPEGGRKQLWPGLDAIAPSKSADAFDVAHLKERLLLIQALETARCFEEGVLTDPREADVGAILGFGYAPWTGGPLSYIDMMGVPSFVARCEAYEQALGPRYRPADLLRKMARDGEGFYPS